MHDGPLADDEVDALLACLAPYARIVLAVSGGADSTALMHLAQAWSSRRARPDPATTVVTINHGLRAAAAGEAAEVCERAAALGFGCRTAVWTGPKPSTGLQAAAREARYRLLAAVAQEIGADAIVTAHTADDQAETVLMRLARGSGVDGLAGIPAAGMLAHRTADGRVTTIDLIRPLLGVARARLVRTLEQAGVGFVMDPSNLDDHFERVRVRKALEVLDGLGLSRAALARTASRMRTARSALERATDALARSAMSVHLDIVHAIDGEALLAEPELGVRLLRRVLAAAGGAARPAELATIEAAIARLRSATTMAPMIFTIGGCIVETTASSPRRVHIYREPDRDGGLPSLHIEPGSAAVWDDRFVASVADEHPAAVEVGPLGADWPRLRTEQPVLEALSLPVRAIRGLPVFRDTGHILAAPALARYARESGEPAAAAALEGPLRASHGPDDQGLYPSLTVTIIDRPGPGEMSDV